MHRMGSILFLLLAASLSATGQEASSKAAAGQLSRTAASLSITSPLTARQIESLRATINDPAGDYFIASREDQKNIVSAFVEDNSKSDPTCLYLAANTAYRNGEIKEAAFLFYAAQIRKRFDYKRYGLGKANGDNIQTYWGFLNQTLRGICSLGDNSQAAGIF